MWTTLEAFTWLIGGFDAGDGRRGSYSLSSLDGFLFNEEYLTNVYRIDGKKLISYPCHEIWRYNLLDYTHPTTIGWKSD